MRLGSPAFAHGEAIPKTYTEDGNNLSPPLTWADVPKGAVELTFICDDPDAPHGTFTHWVVYAIAPAAGALPEGVPRDERLRQPPGALQGLNSFNNNSLGYRGPAPPKGHGIHHYHFRLYALNKPLTLGPGVSKDALLHAMQGKVLAQAELIGTYQRK